MLPDVPNFDYSKSIDRAPNGKFYKYWTFLSATNALSDVDVLVGDLKTKYMRAKFLENKCEKLRGRMIENAGLIATLKPEWQKYHDSHTVANNEMKEASLVIRQKGIIIHEVLHGIVLFPFFSPFDDQQHSYLYRAGATEIETWCSNEEVNQDLNSNKISRFVTGVVNPIPEEWKEF